MDFLLFTSDKLLAKNYLIFHAFSWLILARHTTLDARPICHCHKKAQNSQNFQIYSPPVPLYPLLPCPAGVPDRHTLPFYMPLCGIPKQFFKTHLYKMLISGGHLANAKLNHASKRCAVCKGKRVLLIFEHPLGCFSKMLLPNPYHFKDCG